MERHRPCRRIRNVDADPQSNFADLMPGSVDVWQIDLNPPDWETSGLPLLNDAERARADRYSFPEGRRRSVAARAGVRRVLSRYAGCVPGALQFGYGEHGKPHLLGYPGLEFNLSHSLEVGVLAVSRDHPVGIDIEAPDRHVEFQSLARRYFSLREVELLQDLKDTRLANTFFRIWTGKEAFIKCLGDGLAYPLDQFAVLPDAGNGIGLWVAAGRDRGHGVRLAEVGEIPGFVVTVAVEGNDCAVRWRGAESGPG